MSRSKGVSRHTALQCFRGGVQLFYLFIYFAFPDSLQQHLSGTQGRKGHVVCMCPVNLCFHYVSSVVFVFCFCDQVDVLKCVGNQKRERDAIRSGKRNSPFLLRLPLFYNTVPKLGSASLLFSSHMTLLSHGGCTTLDCRGVSLANDPVWKFSPLKAYQKYLVRIRRAALNDGPPVETALHLDTCKNQPVQCVSRWLLGYPFKNNVSHLAVQTFIRFYRMGEKAT